MTTKQSTKFVFFLCIILMIIIPNFASAVPTPIIESNTLMGINGLAIDGIDYNVSFVDGSYSEVIIPYNSNIWQDYTTAANALDVMMNYIQLEDPAGAGTNPGLMNGIAETPDSAAIITAVGPIYDFFGWRTEYLAAVNFTGDSFRIDSNMYSANILADTTAGVKGDSFRIDETDASTTATYTTLPSKSVVWAVWEEAQSVPEPSTTILLSIGLLGLAGVRSKIKAA